MKISALTIIIIAALCGCATKQPDEPHQRAIYNAHRLQVNTSFSNRKQQTISILYGNMLARQSAATGKHKKGELYELVTFKQANNKYWYGSYINGEVERIERVTTSSSGINGISFNYSVLQGNAPDKADARINSITSHRALIFP